jgi:hypothetical protein
MPCMGALGDMGGTDLNPCALIKVSVPGRSGGKVGIHSRILNSAPNGTAADECGRTHSRHIVRIGPQAERRKRMIGQPEIGNQC